MSPSPWSFSIRTHEALYIRWFGSRYKLTAGCRGSTPMISVRLKKVVRTWVKQWEAIARRVRVCVYRGRNGMSTTIPNFEKNRLAVERLDQAMRAASGDRACIAVETSDGKHFDLAVDRIPAHGPHLPIRRLQGITRTVMEELSVILEAVAEAQR